MTKRPPIPARASCGIFLLAFAFLFATHGGHFYSVDNEIVFRITHRLFRYGFAGFLQPDIPDGFSAIVGIDGRTFSRYPLGLSLLQLPFYALGHYADQKFPSAYNSLVGSGVSIFYVENFAVFAVSLIGPLCGALAVSAIVAIAAELGFSRRTQILLTVIALFATPLWPASRDGFPQIIVTAAIAVAYLNAIRWKANPGLNQVIKIGFAVAILLLVRPFDALLVGSSLVLFALLSLGQIRSLSAWSVAGSAITVISVVGLAAITTIFYNLVRFGSPWQMISEGDETFTTPFLDGLNNLFFSTGRGLVFYAPLGVISLWGFVRLRNYDRTLLSLFLFLFIAYPCAYATYTYWDGGMCWGARYLVPLTPALLLSVGALLEKGFLARACVFVFSVTAFVVQFLGTFIDFHRCHVLQYSGFIPSSTDVTQTPLRAHLQALLHREGLDWIVVRIYETSHFKGVLQYSAIPILCGVSGLILVLGIQPIRVRSGINLLRRGIERLSFNRTSNEVRWNETYFL